MKPFSFQSELGNSFKVEGPPGIATAEGLGNLERCISTIQGPFAAVDTLKRIFCSRRSRTRWNQGDPTSGSEVMSITRPK